MNSFEQVLADIFFPIKAIGEWLNANVAPTLAELHEAIQATQF